MRPAIKRTLNLLPQGTLRLLVGLILAILFAIFIVSKVDWLIVTKTLASARLEHVILSLAFLGISLLARITRWWQMLKPQACNLNFKACVWPYLLGALCSLLVPLRAGDLVRAFGFREQLQSPGTRVLGTLVLERVLDLITLALLFLFFSLGLSNSKILPANFAYLAVTMAIIILLFTFALWIFQESFRNSLISLSRRPYFRKKTSLNNVGTWINHFFDGLSVLKRPGLLIRVLGLTLLIWMMEGAIFVQVVISLGIEVHYIAPLFSFTLATLSTAIPSAPGFIGTFHYFAALGLTAYGADWSQALAFAVVVHLVLMTQFVAILVIFLVSKKRLPNFNLKGDGTGT